MASIAIEFSGAQDILRAAKELFAEQGFDAVSISTIADRAGTSKANIFHHFGSKQGLYFAVMRGAVDRSELNMRAIIEEEDGDARTRLEQAIRAHYALLEEDPERARLIMREVMFSSPQQGQALAEEVFGDHFDVVSNLISTLGLGHGERASFLTFTLVAANVMRFHCRNVMRHFPDSQFQDDMDSYTDSLVALMTGASPAMGEAS